MFKVNLVYIMTSKPCGDTQQDQVKEGREEVKEGGKKRRQQSDISVTIQNADRKRNLSTVPSGKAKYMYFPK